MTLGQNLKAARQLIKITLASLLRDKSALFWAFGFPALLLVGLGLMWGGNGSSPKLKVGLVGSASSAVYVQLRRELVATKLFEFVEGSREAEMAALRAGHRQVVLAYVPAPTAAVAARGDARKSVPATVQLFHAPDADGSVQLAVATIRDRVATIDRRMAGRPPVLRVETTPIREPRGSKPNPIQNFVAAIIALSIVQGGLSAAVSLVSERQKGNSDIFRVPPVSTAVLMAGSLAARVLMIGVQAVTVIMAGVLTFGISMEGSWWALALMVVLGTLAFTAIGEALAMMSPDVDAASGIVTLVSLPMLFLSGLFFPIDGLSGAVRTIALAMPSAYLGDGLRWAVSGVASIAPFPLCVGILGAWMIGSVLFSLKFYRWE